MSLSSARQSFVVLHRYFDSSGGAASCSPEVMKKRLVKMFVCIKGHLFSHVCWRQMIKFNVRNVLDSHHRQLHARVAGYFNEDTKSIITPEVIECSDVESSLDPLTLSVLLDSNNKLV